MLQGLSSSGSCLLGSLLDLLGNLGGGLRGERSLNGLGLLLNSLSLLLDSLDLLSHLSDLGGGNSLVVLSLGLLGSLSLDGCLLSLNDSLETSDVVLNFRLLSLRLDDDLLLSEFLDLLLGVGDGLGAGLDLLLSLDLGNSLSGLLSLELLCLSGDSLFGLSDGMSVSQSILFDLNNSVLVGMLVVSSSDSVDGRSLDLLGDLEGVGGLSSDLDVEGVVGGPGGVDGLDSLGDGGNLRGVSLNDLLVSGDLRLDAGDLLLDGLLLLFLNLLKSLGKSLNSGLQVSELRLGGHLKSLLLIELLVPSVGLLLILNLLGAVLLLGFLLLLNLLLINLLLVHNIGGLDTLRDVGNSLLFGVLSFFLSRLNLALDLSDHNLGLLNLSLRSDLLLSGGLDDFLGGSDLASDDLQLTSERLDIRGLGGGSDLGVDLLLLGSQVGEGFFAGGNGLLNGLNDFFLLSDDLLDLGGLSGTDLLDSGGFLSQFGGSLLLLNDLGGHISGGGSGGSRRSTSDVTLDGNRGNSSWVRGSRNGRGGG